MRTTEHRPVSAHERRAAPDSARRFPVGAEVLAGGGTHFRVWAPRNRRVAVELILSADHTAPHNVQSIDLAPEPDGYFAGLASQGRAGMCYRFRLESGAFPDPASRFQPEGPHGPSQIIDAGRFPWTDTHWRGPARDGLVIYEMHIGTFTREGTWRGAMEQLPELANLGITVLEVMPVADFPGRFGWGYDGVNLFAPTRLYGQPDDFRAFINRAHELGLGVILDVVYNHFGPDGNYLKQFSPDYLTHRYENEWGEAVNFDGDNSGPVREFFLTNAAYWIDEFHLDGLRLDATQQIFDSSPENIMAAISQQVGQAARARSVFVVAECELQDSRLARPREQGGYGIDALWNDDFHHSALVALTGRHEAYYSDHRGSPQEFVSMAKWGFLYQGQWYSWQNRRRGSPAFGLHPWQFVNCLENHDQVANSMHGKRLHQLASPALYRAFTALLLLGPGTPMLFQGQEFAASSPFLYFADHNPELAKLVSEGRRKFLSQFPGIARHARQSWLAEPESENTFNKCKLDFAERERHSSHYHLFRDLLKLRREDPVFAKPVDRGVDGAVLSNAAFVLRFFGEQNGDRLLLVNLGPDLRLDAAPEPLLAPRVDCSWRTTWSSEDPRYGGSGLRPPESEHLWLIPGHAALVMTPENSLRV